MNEKTLNSYEMMLILAPDLGEKGEAEALTFVRDIITSNGGDIYHEDIWGVKEMAYTIEKNDRGFYAVLNFHFDGEKLNVFDQPMKLNKDVVRYMILKTEADYEIKTLEDYEEEAAKEKEENEKEEAAKEAKKVTPKKPVAKKAPVKKVVTKKEAEVDEKLKDIINDPSISL